MECGYSAFLFGESTMNTEKPSENKEEKQEPTPLEIKLDKIIQAMDALLKNEDKDKDKRQELVEQLRKS